MQCNNPCNTPGCALLPTQIDTFTTQFFGAVGKANVGGNVAWQLPCGLDAGIASNPRQPGESLGCYFFRLFETGIHGIAGPAGASGAAGAVGPDAFTETAQDFDQPTLAQPYISIQVAPNQVVQPGLFAEIAGSGFYTVLNVSGTSVLFQLLSPFSSSPPIIPSGAIVIIAGLPGITVQGPKGPKGDTGNAGNQGPTGATGITGQQGNKGSATHLQSGASPVLGAGALTSVYSPTGALFTTPDNSLSTYLVLFMAFGSWSNLGGGTLSGSVFLKVVDPTLTDVPGAERVFTSVSNAATGASMFFMIPLILTNTTGSVASWRLYAKTSISGPNKQGFGGAGPNFIKWIKL
jgi:hypothetical protein